MQTPHSSPTTVASTRMCASGRLRRLVVGAFVVAACVVALLACTDWLVVSSTEALIYSEPSKLPHRSVALVLGCSPRAQGGRRNLYFAHRVEAAAQLYHLKKVQKLLLSGDNRALNYNEPLALKRALNEKGVPSRDLVLDYAGFRTFDSIVRAKLVFGTDDFVVVSQPFHNHRALYIARRMGYRAIGYNAQSVQGGKAAFRTRIRETLARVLMLLDVHILGTEPHFVGQKEPILVSAQGLNARPERNNSTQAAEKLVRLHE